MAKKPDEPRGECITRGCAAPVVMYLVRRSDGQIAMRWCSEHWLAFGKSREGSGMGGINVVDYNKGKRPEKSVVASSDEKRRQPDSQPGARDSEEAESPLGYTDSGAPIGGGCLPSDATERRPAPRPQNNDTVPATVAPQPQAQAHPLAAYQPGGVVRFTPEQEAILRQPVNPELIEIRYDGAVYMPGGWFRKVLNDAFGPGGWRLLPLENPMEDGREYAMRCALVAEGRVIAETYAEYKANQLYGKPSKGNIYESLCTDGITKCCKSLGVAEELWYPAFVRNWQDLYAEKVKNSDGKMVWQRKDANMGHDQFKEGYSHESEYRRVGSLLEENQRQLDQIADPDAWMHSTEEGVE